MRGGGYFDEFDPAGDRNTVSRYDGPCNPDSGAQFGATRLVLDLSRTDIDDASVAAATAIGAKSPARNDGVSWSDFRYLGHSRDTETGDFDVFAMDRSQKTDLGELSKEAKATIRLFLQRKLGSAVDIDSVEVDL